MKKTAFAIVAGIAIIAAGCAARKNNPGNNIYGKKYIKEMMHSVFAWQLANPVTGNATVADDWARAVFYIGITRAGLQTGDAACLDAAMHWSDSLQYKLGPRLRHSDDHTRGQVFLDLYAVKKDPIMYAAVQQQFDSIMLQPDLYPRERWWCDALFMSPPVWARLAQATGQQKYNDYMNHMWWDVTDFLFDKQENLYYRDKSFFDKKTSHGKKIFWGRGNGWVMGGLVQVLERLPASSPYYTRYQELFKKMAAKIVTLQNPDGLWPPSLLDAAEFPNKETSGSGFYTFALAWGINNGLLDAPSYLPAVQKGWQALTAAVQPDGKLTYVQKIGAKPEFVQESDNQEYGSGAFLMAGTEMLKLARKN